jgi:hypothetical protein
MEHASLRMRVGLLLGAAVLAGVTLLPVPGARAATLMDGVGLLTPGMACGPGETPVGVAGPLARVRADAAAPARGRGAAKAARPSEPRRGQQAARPAKPPSREARKAPQSEPPEPRAAVLRSFYTCDASPLSNLAEGTGWRLVGPLRKG